MKVQKNKPKQYGSEKLRLNKHEALCCEKGGRTLCVNICTVVKHLHGSGALTSWDPSKPNAEMKAEHRRAEKGVSCC